MGLIVIRERDLRLSVCIVLFVALSSMSVMQRGAINSLTTFQVAVHIMQRGGPVYQVRRVSHGLKYIHNCF